MEPRIVEGKLTFTCDKDPEPQPADVHIIGPDGETIWEGEATMERTGEGLTLRAKGDWGEDITMEITGPPLP